jgi:hypothetical protein
MGFLLQYRNVDIRSNKVYHSVNQNAGRETRVLLDAGNLTVWGHVVAGKQCSISPVRPSNPPGTIHHINSAWGLSPSLPTVLYYLGCTIEIASCKRNEYSSVEEWLKARRARMMCTGLGLLSNDRVSVPSALEHEILRVIEVLVVMKLISQTKSYGTPLKQDIFLRRLNCRG